MSHKKDEQNKPSPEGGYLGAVLNQALPPPASVPPPPPTRRKKTREGEQQVLETADLQEEISATVNQQENAEGQIHNLADLQNNNIASSGENTFASLQIREESSMQETENKEKSVANQQSRQSGSSQSSSPVRTQERNEPNLQITGIGDLQVTDIVKALELVVAKQQRQQAAKAQKEDNADLLIRLLATLPDSILDIDKYRSTALLNKRKINQGVTAPEAVFLLYKAVAISLTAYGEKTAASDLMARILIEGLVERVLPHLQDCYQSKQPPATP